MHLKQKSIDMERGGGGDGKHRSSQTAAQEPRGMNPLMRLRDLGWRGRKPFLLCLRHIEFSVNELEGKIS